jgi:hypothetical protein
VTTRRRASSASANLSAAFHDPTLTLLDDPSAAKSPAPSELFEARNAAPRAPPLPCPEAVEGRTRAAASVVIFVEIPRRHALGDGADADAIAQEIVEC